MATMGKTNDQSDDERRMSEALDKVASEISGSDTVQQVAVAYVLNKTHNVFPLVGRRGRARSST